MSCSYSKLHLSLIFKQALKLFLAFFIIVIKPYAGFLN